MNTDRFHSGYIKSIGINLHYDSKIASIADKTVTIVYENLQQETIDKIMVLLKSDNNS